MIQRYREIHDMLHTLLGMPTNILGECWPTGSPWMLPEWGWGGAYPVRGLGGAGTQARLWVPCRWGGGGDVWPGPQDFLRKHGCCLSNPLGSHKDGGTSMF